MAEGGCRANKPRPGPACRLQPPCPKSLSVCLCPPLFLSVLSCPSVSPCLSLCSCDSCLVLSLSLSLTPHLSLPLSASLLAPLCLLPPLPPPGSFGFSSDVFIMDTIGGGEVSLGDLADLTVTNDNDLSCDVSPQGAPPSTAPVRWSVLSPLHVRTRGADADRVGHLTGTKVRGLEGSGARVFIMVPGSFSRRCSLPPWLTHSPSLGATTAGGEARGNQIEGQCQRRTGAPGRRQCG